MLATRRADHRDELKNKVKNRKQGSGWREARWAGLASDVLILRTFSDASSLEIHQLTPANNNR